MNSSLPIDPILPQILDSLSSGKNIVLVAEPGSGKTTRVPPSLLATPWLQGKKILMLEPRRIAAKAAASFIASQRNEKLGEVVGFRIRGESRISPGTRLEVLTEGLLTRMIQSDQSLEDVGLVIFDEFHERSIHGDLSLALVLETQRVLRPDLRIMLMSATLESEEVAKLIGNAQIINCPGRQYPVEIRYGKEMSLRLNDNTLIDTIRRAHTEEIGDILVFLPGRGEINRIAEKIRALPFSQTSKILMLHSDVRGEDQDRILSPRENDPRRIILTTNVAETSLTIPRVRIVVDAGLMRVPRFNPRRGVSGLETIAVSLASAKQRAGRAGRQSAGVCYRLWSQQEERDLNPFNQAEIMYTDLAPVLLELSAWGNSNIEAFSFMSLPPNAHVLQAKQVLAYIGALNVDGVITKHGKDLIKLALPPRLSHMLTIARSHGAGREACELIALLEEPLPALDRDVDCIVSNRMLELAQSAKGKGSYPKHSVKRIEEEAARLGKLVELSTPKTQSKISTGILIALAYPERLAKQREEGSARFLMRNGAGALVTERSVLRKHEYLAIAHLDGLGNESRVFLAEPLTIEEIREFFGHEIIRSEEASWEDSSLSVRAYERETLGSLVLSEKRTHCTDESAMKLILNAVVEKGLSILSFSQSALSTIDRVRWLNSRGLGSDALPDLSSDGLISDLENWLAPFLPGVRKISDLTPDILDNALSLKVSRTIVKLIEELAPTNFMLPSGREVVISYEGPRAPSIAGKLQEMFGQPFTPRIAKGAVPLTIELLSPAGRPLQVTADLESFWNNSYQEVRKEMAGRYPKYSWPLDPKEATATRGAKRRT